MLLTVAEARQQECPFMRYCVNEPDVANYKVPPMYAQRTCGGSDCKMGWRWYDHVLSDAARQRLNKAREENEALGSPDRAVRLAIDRALNHVPRGYCGFAGKPSHV